MSIPTPAGDRDDAGGSRQPVHAPVLLGETLAVLDLVPGLVVVDGTVGAGGHAREVASQLGPTGFVLGLDRDSEILSRAGAAVAEGATEAAGWPRISLHHLIYSRMQEALAADGQVGCDRVLLDLGVSSLQLDKADRGFSFMTDGPLDMRMDASAGESAADWLRSVPEQDLANALFELGDERHSRRIARAIVDQRRRAPLLRTGQLCDVVVGALPGAARRQRIHPATRTFQAIRMVVNDELGELRRGLQAARDCVRPGGRIAVISFHSTEDRIVKRFLRENCKVVTKKPIRASQAEIAKNRRSRSARLRCGIVEGQVAR